MIRPHVPLPDGIGITVDAGVIRNQAQVRRVPQINIGMVVPVWRIRPRLPALPARLVSIGMELPVLRILAEVLAEDAVLGQVKAIVLRIQDVYGIARAIIATSSKSRSFYKCPLTSIGGHLLFTFSFP